MRLLCDTHVWLWSLIEANRLESSVRKLLLDERAELFVSTASIWEAVRMVEAGRVRTAGDIAPVEWVRKTLRQGPYREAKVNADIVLTSLELILPHSDSVDRLIAATAAAEDMVLLTADEHLLACPSLTTLRAA